MGKVRQESYIVKNAKIKQGWGFNLFKMLKKVWLRSNVIEIATIMYGWGLYCSQSKNWYGWDFNLFKTLKIRCGWGLILLKKLK